MRELRGLRQMGNKTPLLLKGVNGCIAQLVRAGASKTLSLRGFESHYALKMKRKKKYQEARNFAGNFFMLGVTIFCFGMILLHILGII